MAGIVDVPPRLPGELLAFRQRHNLTRRAFSYLAKDDPEVPRFSRGVVRDLEIGRGKRVLTYVLDGVVRSMQKLEPDFRLDLPSSAAPSKEASSLPAPETPPVSRQNDLFDRLARFVPCLDEEQKNLVVQIVGDIAYAGYVMKGIKEAIAVFLDEGAGPEA